MEKTTYDQCQIQGLRAKAQSCVWNDAVYS